MSANSFFENPILNSPYEYPRRHWKMDADNKPTGEIAEARRPSSNRTPIATPRAKGQGEKALQQDLFLDSSKGVDYRENELINYIRAEVDNWRASPEENWHVTAETARLLKHWRSFEFPSYRPFFCQVEAAETLIWLVEAAPNYKNGKEFLRRLAEVNADADPDLYRIALKLATGAGKTTVMAMIVACQKVNLAIMRDVQAKGQSQVRAIIDSFMPTGSTSRVNFRISRRSKILWETSPAASHVNYAVCDSSWEAIFCRVLEEYPQTISYVKNFNLGFEVPYVMGTENRHYLPDFIVLVDDGHGKGDPLHLIVEVKGYRYVDANIKKATMETLWILGVNAEKTYGRWAFIELNQNDFTLDGLTSDEALLENCREAYVAKIDELRGA